MTKETFKFQQTNKLSKPPDQLLYIILCGTDLLERLDSFVVKNPICNFTHLFQKSVFEQSVRVTDVFLRKAFFQMLTVAKISKHCSPCEERQYSLPCLQRPVSDMTLSQKTDVHILNCSRLSFLSVPTSKISSSVRISK